VTRGGGILPPCPSFSYARAIGRIFFPIMNQSFQYHRLVLGYHGCDQSVADRVLAGEDMLKKSEKHYDWLGSGIYFWEHGPERAMDWAIEQKQRGKITSPAVVGAVIHLGNCFDFMDVRYTRVLKDAYPQFEDYCKRNGKELPVNESSSDHDVDLLLRKLDCSMINWLCQFMESEQIGKFDSVRGMFREATPAFPGSSIHLKSHIQLAIRNSACILGYFRPH
jgi:hypothetical protein